MCILWYCGSLEGILAAFRSLEGLLGALGERLGDVLEALEGLLEASWKPLGGLLRASGSREASKEPPGTPPDAIFTCFYVFLACILEESTPCA